MTIAPPSPALSALTPASIVELIKRWDRPVPRYTSYPTALDFVEITEETLRTHLARVDAAAQEPLSIYVHLPFCDERCWFCGCHVVISPHKSRARPYLDWVKKELELVAAALPNRRTLGQLHFGGGTPTYFSPSELASLAREITTTFRPTPTAELAVEVDPRVTHTTHLEALAAEGFNRVSFGVQDLDPKVQRAIGRVQSAESVQTLVHAARQLGYRGINADLIYGLPYQTPEGIANTVDRVLDMGIDRSALYSFAWLPDGRGHQKKIDPQDLPTGDSKLLLFATARERFLLQGFQTIGMDHFSHPNDELAIARREHRLRRNFQGYTTLPSADVVGLGISAIGDVAGALVQSEKKLNRYQEILSDNHLPALRGAVRSEDDTQRGWVIAELMCNMRVVYKDFANRFGLHFQSHFHREMEQLKSLQADGLVNLQEDQLQATELGEVLIRNLAVVFDAYRRAPTQRQGQFSRAV